MIGTLFVATSNSISHPDDAWPALVDGIDRLCSHYEVSCVAMPMVQPNEIALASYLLDREGYSVELMMTTTKAYQQTWQVNWLDALVDLVARPTCFVSWYQKRIESRQPLTKWYLERAVAVAVIRPADDRHLFNHVLTQAEDWSMAQYRLDPDSYGVTKLKPTTKEDD